MKETFFYFCHLIYQHDPVLATVDADTAQIICRSAQKEYLSCEGVLKMEQWVNHEYDSWIKNYRFVSDHMPDKARKILTDDKADA
jgi:hypothetical protein